MARGGFLGRIGRAIKNIVAPSPREREAPPPKPPPEPPQERGARRAYQSVWRVEAQKRRHQDFDKHYELFHRLIDPIEENPSERLDLWHSYIRNMINGEGQFRRNSSQNMFWRDTGLDPDTFNWARWREAMGFVGKRRSRTP